MGNCSEIFFKMPCCTVLSRKSCDWKYKHHYATVLTFMKNSKKLIESTALVMMATWSVFLWVEWRLTLDMDIRLHVCIIFDLRMTKCTYFEDVKFSSFSKAVENSTISSSAIFADSQSQCTRFAIIFFSSAKGGRLNDQLITKKSQLGIQWPTFSSSFEFSSGCIKNGSPLFSFAHSVSQKSPVIGRPSGSQG